MKVVRCGNGHFYDADKYSQCPHCLNGLKKVRRDGYKGEISLDLADDAVIRNVPRAIDEDLTVLLDDDVTAVIDDDVTEVIDDDRTELIDDDKTELLR